MKHLLLSIILILAGISGFSQKQFEGTIIYNLHSVAEEKKDDGQLTVLFGKNGIRLKVEDKKGEDKEEQLIRLDSGKIYSLNMEEKTFRAKKLIVKKKNEQSFTGKKIAGYATSPVDLSDANSISALFGGYFRGGQAIFYLADSLFYFIPEKYSSNMELVFIHGNRIALGVDFKLGIYGSWYDEDEEKDEKKDIDRMTITAEAISVKWEVLPESAFSLPPDFVKLNFEALIDSVAVADSLMQMMDTTAVPQKAPAKKPPVNKKQPAKPKTKTNAQSTPLKKPG